MSEPWRPEGAPAFSMNFSKELENQLALMTEWINTELERGATDALVDALRKKGWKVIPPETRSSAHIEAGARIIRGRVQDIDWDDGAAWMDTLRAALDAAQEEAR
jgi:hypothetical protein